MDRKTLDAAARVMASFRERLGALGSHDAAPPQEGNSPAGRASAPALGEPAMADASTSDPEHWQQDALPTEMGMAFAVRQASQPL